MTLGERLRKLREARGLHPNEVAERGGFHVVTLYKWERDGSTPKVDDAAKLADVLGVSLDQLAGREEWTPPSAELAAAAEALREVREARDRMDRAEEQLLRALGQEDGKVQQQSTDGSVAEPAPAPYAAAESLGRRITQLRFERGIPDFEAAEQAGFTLDQWTDLEGDTLIPTAAQLRAVARVIGEEHLLELHRLRRQAPAHQLAESLTPLQGVARTAYQKPTKKDPGPYVRAVESMDPRLRQALELWCARERGDGSLKAMAAELRAAQEMSEEQRRDWLEAIAALVNLAEE